jgi:hypothetical protein
MLILLMMGSSGFAQKICLTDQYRSHVLSNYPALNVRYDHLSLDPLLNKKLASLTGIINIPVAVHVLYHKDSLQQKISRELIDAQIAQLNKDFSGANADTSIVPKAFRSFVADCKIQFTLKDEDFEVVETTKSSFNCAFRGKFKPHYDPIKFDVEGGRNGKASTQYLNIWIGNISNGLYSSALLGYSSSQTAINRYDGVVINYRMIGPTYTKILIGKDSVYNAGKTITHEVGHWLGLLHLWGSKSCGDDYISDTPRQLGPNVGIRRTPHYTCTNITTGDQYMNFMDYSDDSVLVMFTHKQKDRMRSLFVEGGARSTFMQNVFINEVVNLDTSKRTDQFTPVVTNLSTTTLEKRKIIQEKIITWTPSEGATNYVVQYRKIGADTWDTVTSTINKITVKDLKVNNTYEIQIKALLNNDAFSANSVPYIFQVTH